MAGPSEDESEGERRSATRPSSVPPPPRRRLWPAGALLVVVVALVVWLVDREVGAPDPLRVLVAVDVDGQWWQGSRPAARVADDLSATIGELGFEPVRAGAPETARILESAESPVAAARELGAAFVIAGRVTPRVTELPVAEGFYEVALDGRVTVRHVDEPKPFAEERAQTHAGAKDRDRAMDLAAESLARHVLDATLPAIAAHPEVDRLLAAQDAKLLDRLAPTKTYVAARKAHLDDAAAAYAKLAAARAEEEERGPLTFHSPADADDRLIAVREPGLIVATAEVRPFYSARRLELLRSESLAAVGWRPVNEEPAPLSETIWRGYNAFTYPSVSEDGTRVALIEDLYGWGRSLVVLDEGEPPRRLRTEATRRLSEPRLSPDGAHVALVDRACRGCAKEIAVVDAASGEERRRLAEIDASFLGPFAWLDADRLMVVMDPRDGDEGLWAVPLAADQPLQPLMSGEAGAGLSDPAASPDGRLVAAAAPQRGAIVTLDLTGDETTSHLVAGEASALAFSPDGRRLVFELKTPDRRYRDIAVLTVEGSEVSHLTSNDSPDRHPLWSPDGGRVFFEARNADPVFGRSRAVVRIVSVPAR